MPRRRRRLKPDRIQSLRINGFRSLDDVDIKGLPPQASVLISPNGSGKSNLFCFLEMASWMISDHDLQKFVQRYGGADDQLFGGSKVSKRTKVEIALRNGMSLIDCCFIQEFAHPNRLIFVKKKYRTRLPYSKLDTPWTNLSVNSSESQILRKSSTSAVESWTLNLAAEIRRLFRKCRVFQFHDSSFYSDFKKSWDIEDNFDLWSHGGNLASVLLRLEQDCAKRFSVICKDIRRAIPNFDTFHIEESYGRVLLRWKPKGSPSHFRWNITILHIANLTESSA